MTESASSRVIAAARKLWPAYSVFSSAGSTLGALDRHVRPVIQEIYAAIRALDASAEVVRPVIPPDAFGVGIRDKDDADIGIIAGPFATAEEAEEYAPPVDLDHPFHRIFIVYFTADDRFIIAEWDGQRWLPSDGSGAGL